MYSVSVDHLLTMDALGPCMEKKPFKSLSHGTQLCFGMPSPAWHNSTLRSIPNCPKELVSFLHLAVAKRSSCWSRRSQSRNPFPSSHEASDISSAAKHEIEPRCSMHKTGGLDLYANYGYKASNQHFVLCDAKWHFNNFKLVCWC